jgi:hypothetical protein
MADNVGITPGTGATAAADDIDGALHQRIKITVGSDGVSRGDVDVTNPMPVRQDDLRSIEQAAEQLNTAKIPTGNDEPLQLVGLHPNFPLPIDTATPMPIAGLGPIGERRQVAVDDVGSLRLADSFGPIPFNGQTSAGIQPLLEFDTRHYSTIVVNLVLFTGGSGITVVQSNDRINWYQVRGYNFTSNGFEMVVNLNASGQFGAYPVVGRYARLQAVSSTGRLTGTVVLRSGFALSFSNPNGTVSTNIAAVNGATVATGGTGLQAIGGPTAVGGNPGINNPIQISGSDGTNVRRILTDTAGNTTVVGHVTTGATLIPATSDRGPVLVGAADLERRAQRMVVDGLGRLRIQIEESGTKDDGVIDALNNVVRELKLMNARLADLPYYLGVNAVMPDDSNAFRDDPTIFNQ